MSNFKSNHIKKKNSNTKIDRLNTKIDRLNVLRIASKCYATFQILKMQLIRMMATIVLFIKKTFFSLLFEKKLKYKLLKSKVIS